MTTETPTLAERIERLTEAVNAMTPGPWVTRPDLGEPWAKSIYTRPGYGRILGDVEAVSDAAGIIALRNDAMKIIADLARELAEAKRLNVRTADAGGVVIGELRQQLAAAISRERGLREAMQETIDDISEHHMDSVAERRASHRLKIALESGEAADGWRPIETAPQDGTLVDLWMKEHWSRHMNRDGTPHGSGETRTARRLTDCYWVVDGHDRQGKERSGWAMCKSLVMDDEIITHWRPLPPPPATQDRPDPK